MNEVNDPGVLAPLVKAVGWLVSASIAIGLSWRGRANWEPSEQDIPQAPSKVAGLLTAVLLGIIWTQMAYEQHEPSLVTLASSLAGATLVFLLVYGFLISSMTFTKRRSPEPDKVVEEKIIGGFRLTEQARSIRKERGLTTQEIFEGAAYKEDRVWTRGFRSLAKQTFVLCYIGLVVCGSIALASAAILLLLKRT